MKTLIVFGADLPREAWIKQMMLALLPLLPEGYSLGIEDDDFLNDTGSYFADIAVEALNELHRNGAPGYSIHVQWAIEQGNLYRIVSS